jgi:choline transport protein
MSLILRARSHGANILRTTEYHWAAEHSHIKWRPVISYVSGWVTLTGWIAAVASCCFLLGTMITGIAVLNYDGYEPKRWHLTLIMIGFMLLAAACNIFCKKIVPLFEATGLVLHVLFFGLIFITVLATSTKAPATNVWATFINSGGWPNDGITFCIGFLGPAFSIAGVDAVVHM